MAESGHYPPTEEEKKDMMKKMGMEEEEIEEMLGRKEKPEFPPSVEIRESWTRGPWLSEKTKESIKSIAEVIGCFAVVGGVAGALGGSIFGTAYLSALTSKSPYKGNGSYKVTLIGWEVKKAFGDDYVTLDSNGTLTINECKSIFSNANDIRPELTLFDTDNDGLVDEITSRYDHNWGTVERRNPCQPIFQKFDRKYKEYKEQLADLIQKAEKEWENR